MKFVRVAVGVLNQTPLDWRGNSERIVAAIAAAREQGATVLCLPEMCISGYGCEDAFLSNHLVETAELVLADLLPETRGMIVSLGLPVMHRKALFNAACLAVDGRAVALVAKRFLAGEGIHYEPRWFKAWPEGASTTVELCGAQVKMGDLVVDCGGLKLGFEICEDAWASERPAADLSARGVDVILNPSASHFAFGKAEVRKRLVLEGSRAFGVSYLYSNLLGNEAGRAIYDGGGLIASRGRMLAVGSRFSYRDVGVDSAVIDLDATRMEQARSNTYSPDLCEDEGRVVVDFDLPEIEPSRSEPVEAAWESGEHVKAEEFTRAVALALFDYLRKSKSHGFVVSLSGGADSCAVSCLVALMVRLAVDELGRTGFLAKLPGADRFSPETKSADPINDLVGGLLTCVYQSTANSSETTREAARQVAEAIGAEFMQFDVEKLVQAYVDMVSQAEGRQLSWERDDLALQNIQARVRAPGVWMLANLRQALLLATSNRSEAAVGYATMDGDTCGGVSPIAGIDKAYLRKWLLWLERDGPEGAGPIPAVKAVNVQQPTAELRPLSEGQTDEDDLMPYDLLDAIERAAIRDKHSPLEVYRLMRSSFEQYPAPQLGVWVERFFQLWSRNQWKRERYAPSFHLDDENLDPKTWCRFPILSGGFERELQQLRAHLDRDPD
jgi:NAD+ synthase (glutamine-hydrolysing)